jgi:HK97 family phage major capsid protein
MNLKKLQQDRADAFNAAKALHDAAASANRAMTADELAQYEAHKANVKNLDANIAIAKEQLEAERTAPAAGVVVGENLAEKKPWAHAGEFLGAVRKQAASHGRSVDPRLFAAAAIGANETIDSQGGFLVPTEIANDLLTKTYSTGLVTSKCDRIPMGSGRLAIPRVDETSRVDGQRYGGILVYREEEAGAYQATKSKLDKLELVANKCIGLTYLTEELEEDANAAALRKWVFDVFPQAFAFRFDNEVLNGTGAGQFLGILQSGVPVQIAPQNNAALAPQTQDILNMWQQLWGPNRANACWFINQNLEASLLQLTRGTGVAVELLYQLPGSKNNPNGQYPTMMGRPVIPIEQSATMGTVGDIILADFSEYLIGERGEMRQDSSIHVQFLTGQNVFRWMVRNDGQPKWKKPLTPYQGNVQFSPFVTLGART